MSDSKIHPIVMPKWGLSMSEGKVNDWLVDDAAEINIGDEMLDVETDKIAGAVEATAAGTLRRRVAKPDEVLPVGALLGVLTEGEVVDAEVDAFVEQFQANFVPETDSDEQAESAYRRIEVGGHSLRYTQQGAGSETVVLVHGFGGDLDNWLFNLGDLAADYTVYALDLPGHGQSSKRVGDGSLASLTQALVDFMDGVGIERAHLVGHSMGGAIIQQLASMVPARAQSLSLICSAGLGIEINSGYINGFVDSQGRRDTKRVLEQLFADSSLVSRQMVEDILKYKRLDGVNEALRTIAGAIFSDGKQTTVLRDNLSQFAMPVQVLWGAKDQIVPAAHSEGLPDQVAVTVFEESGHMVQMEAAGEINKALRSHFSRVG